MSNYLKVLIALLVYIAVYLLTEATFVLYHKLNYLVSSTYYNWPYFVTSLLSIPVIFYFSRAYNLPLHRFFHKLTLKQLGFIILLSLGIIQLHPIYGHPVFYMKGLKFYEFAAITFDYKPTSFLYFSTFIFLGPVTTELFHRGIIFNLLKRSLPPAYALIISSFIFSIAYLNPHRILHTFFYGIAFGWIFEKSNNLLAPILTHITVNILVYLTSLKVISAESPYSLLYYLLTISAVCFLFYLYRNSNKIFSSV